MNDKDQIVMFIYTDGSCSQNPGPGGWGVVFVDRYNNVVNTLYGYNIATTNNRMELSAAVEALKFLNNNIIYSPLNIFVDSTYVKNGVTNWIKKWKSNNWRTSNNVSVKNQDLWLELDYLSNKLSPSWNWVKSHGTSIHNNAADLLTQKVTKEAIIIFSNSTKCV